MAAAPSVLSDALPATASRDELAVLSIRLSSPDEAATNHLPLVTLDLKLRGVASGSWSVLASEIGLPSRAEELLLHNHDALSRSRRYVSEVLNGFSPYHLFDVADGILASLSKHERLRGVAEALGEASDRAENAADALHRRARYGRKRIEGLAHDWGWGLEPEDYRTLRESYPRFVDFVSESIVEGLKALEPHVDALTETRADQVRRMLPTKFLPLRITRGIRDALLAAAWRQPLWLEFAPEPGYLPIVPWEAWLQDVHAGQVLRLSPHPVDAKPTVGPLRVLLCCTAPSPEHAPSYKAVASAVEGLMDALHPTPIVHLFADAAYRSALEQRLGSRPSLTIYAPPSEPAEQLSVSNPWTTWVRERLGPVAVDVLHVLAPTGFSGTEPVVMGAGDPVFSGTEPSFVRMLRALELVQLANDAGASSILLTAFGGQASRTAGRLLCDELAMLRPGAVGLHDIALDEWTRTYGGELTIAHLYRYLAGRDFSSSRDPAMLLYCHPQRFLAKESTRHIGARTAQPLWVAATQRFVEQTLSGTLGELASSDASDPVRAGTVEALRFLTQLVEQTKPGTEEQWET